MMLAISSLRSHHPIKSRFYEKRTTSSSIFATTLRFRLGISELIIG